MNIEKKLIVLEKVAKDLNQNNITWAVGASLLLYFKDIVMDFNDIDITVDEKDVSRVKEILSQYGTLQESNPHSQYKTNVFLEYEIEDVAFDIMAGLTIVNESGEHYFPLQKEDCTDFTLLNGTPIPLQSVQSWKTYYALMNRPKKVALIEKNFK